jgi:hypothetical protein
MHAAEVYGTAFSQGLRPESKLTVSEWADKYRLLLAARVSRSRALAHGSNALPARDHGRTFVFVTL